MLSEVTLSMLSGFLQGSGRQVAPLDGRHVRSDCSSNTAQQQHTQQQHYNSLLAINTQNALAS